jgi:hypothetical protein
LKLDSKVDVSARGSIKRKRARKLQKPTKVYIYDGGRFHTPHIKERGIPEFEIKFSAAFILPTFPKFPVCGL